MFLMLEYTNFIYLLFLYNPAFVVQSWKSAPSYLWFMSMIPLKTYFNYTVKWLNSIHRPNMDLKR